jgi:hypothetical protein
MKGSEEGENGPVKDAVRCGTASEALAVLRKALDGARRVEVVTAKGNDGVRGERFAADQASEGEVLLVRIGVRVVAAISSLLLLHEGSRRCRVREERVVELPAVHVVAAVVQELRKKRKSAIETRKCEKGKGKLTLQVSPKPQNPVSVRWGGRESQHRSDVGEREERNAPL